jgi:aromatic-amino-acid transaminase
LSQTAPTADRESFLDPATLARPADDPIFALNAEASRRARAGEAIVNATLGALFEDDGRLATLPAVFDALRAVPLERAVAYPPIAGEPAFLAAVVRDLFGASPLAGNAVAVATPGGTGAIHHAVADFLEPGDALLTPELFWQPYQTIAEHTGRRVETFRMFDASRRFDVAAMSRALERCFERQRRALVILNMPCNNPTGYALDATEWREVAAALRAAAERGPVTLLLDLAYAKFGGSDAGAWVESAAALGPEVLVAVAWTASKSFALYGARIGALVAVHPDERERRRIGNALSFACRGTWSNCNHLGMLAVTALLTDPELARRADLDRARLRGLLDERVREFKRLAEAAELDHPRYEGGFFVSVFTPAPERTAARMRELGVYVVPIHGAVRVALCSIATRDVPRLVDALADGVRAAGSARP